MCQNIFYNVIWWCCETYLKHVITWNSDTPDTDDADFSKSYIISAKEINSIFNENAENNSASKQQNEAEKVGQKRSKASGSGSRGKKRAKIVITDDRRNENKVSVVSNGRELVGRNVEHFVILMRRINKAGTEVWFWQCLGKTDSRCAIIVSKM